MQQGVQTDAKCNIQQCWELLVVCTWLNVCRLMKLAFINLIISMPDMITVWLKDVVFVLQASKGSLLRATISRQHERVKELPESGQDVEQSDEVLVFFSLCKSNVIPGLSRSHYLWILFVYSE